MVQLHEMQYHTSPFSLKVQITHPHFFFFAENPYSLRRAVVENEAVQITHLHSVGYSDGIVLSPCINNYATTTTLPASFFWVLDNSSTVVS
jgi:hypothetical protein